MLTLLVSNIQNLPNAKFYYNNPKLYCFTVPQTPPTYIYNLDILL